MGVLDKTQLRPNKGKEKRLIEFSISFSFFLFFFFCWQSNFSAFYFIFKLYNIVLVLPNIEMNVGGNAN